MPQAILQNIQGSSATLLFQNRTTRIRIGSASIRPDKQEGDHATPTGTLPLRRVLYRADRTPRPVTSLPVEPIAPNDGWCDDTTHPDYNRQIALPHPASHETLWRDDHSYDIIVVLGWNDAPPIPGRGSAIFLHLPTRSGVTEGCLATDEPTLRALLGAGLTEIVVPAPA